MLRVVLSQDLTSKLNRYEVSLQKQLSQTLRDLSKLQDERQRRATVPKDRRLVEEAELEFAGSIVQRAGRADRARSRLGALPLIFDDR